jgi:TetR/AcrR family transcriptional regulator, transcriptional repressor of bet genes
MPRFVDREDRRRLMAETAADLIGAQGLDALTFRNVAVASGSSTTVVTHYFADKRELLLWTFEVVAQRSGARFDGARSRGGGLRECIEALLPLDPARQRDWRVHGCYWGMATSDRELAEKQALHVRSGQRRIELLLREQYPRLRDRDVELIARRLVALLNGIGVHSVLDPDHWPAAKQRRCVRDELEAIAAVHGRTDHTDVA